MVTAAGRQGDDFSYYDSTIGCSFQFNPKSLESTIISEDPQEVANSDLRESLIKEMYAL